MTSLEAANAALLKKRKAAEAQIRAGSIVLPAASPSTQAQPAAFFDPGEPDFDRLALADEPIGCPCRGRGYTVDLETNSAMPCGCQRKRYAAPADVPAAELASRGCADPEVNRALKEHWSSKHQAWPLELDHWPRMELSEGVGRPGDRPRWLYIWGPTGSGKGVGAAWIMRRALAKGNSASWIPVREGIANYYQHIRDDAPAPVLLRLRHTFAVLDDLGREREDLASHLDVLEMFVEARHTNPRGFQVVTSNLSPGELKGIAGMERIASRVLSGHRLRMDGPDARERRWRWSKAELPAIAQD